MQEKSLTISEAAERLGVSDATVRRRIKSGSLKADLKPGPYGEQFYIDPDEIKTAIEVQYVIPVKQEVGLKELGQLIDQSVSKSLERFHADFESMGTSIGQAIKAQNEVLQTQNEALKKEIETLHDSIIAGEKRQEERNAASEGRQKERDAASEKRQEEREATHFELVDQRLKELHIEPKKGFWARLFGK